MMEITETRHKIKSPETNKSVTGQSHMEKKKKIFQLSLPVDFKWRHGKDNIYKRVLEWIFNLFHQLFTFCFTNEPKLTVQTTQSYKLNRLDAY